MERMIVRGLYAMLAAALTPGLSGAQAVGAPPARGRDQCFDVTQKSNVLALNGRTILVRVFGDIYQIDTETCPRLNRPDPIIDFIVPGPTYVCGRSDYRLIVGEPGLKGTLRPCFVQTQHRLSQAERAALPPNSTP